eukprot:364738-Chlamydomonas_euryale.AAC.6
MTPAVEIDDDGAFPFIMMTMRNLAGRTCILLQGHKHVTYDALLQSACRSAMQLSTAHGLRSETTVVIGGGMMEWRGGAGGGGGAARGVHDDRSLRLSTGTVLNMAVSPTELLDIAAALVRRTLPVAVAVVVEGAPCRAPDGGGGEGGKPRVKGALHTKLTQATQG